MKVVAFNGSARKDGNTASLVRIVLAELEKEGIDTELVQLAGEVLAGCRACDGCAGLGGHCAITSDGVNGYIDKMVAAEGVIIASPVYVSDVSANVKALMERVCYCGCDLSRKVGASIVAVRRGGAIHAYDSINHFLAIMQLVQPGAVYWGLGVGKDPGDVASDTEGLDTMRSLGRNMSWLLKKLYG